MSDVQYDYLTIEDPNKLPELSADGWQMAPNQPFAGKVIMQRPKVQEVAPEPEPEPMSPPMADLARRLDEAAGRVGGATGTPLPVPTAEIRPQEGVNLHYVVAKSRGVRKLAPARSEKVILGRGTRHQHEATVVGKMADTRFSGRVGASPARFDYTSNRSGVVGVPGGVPGEMPPERGRRLFKALANKDVEQAMVLFEDVAAELQRQFHERSQAALDAIEDPVKRARATIVTVILRPLAPQAKFINWGESRYRRSLESGDDHIGMNVLCEYHQVIRFDPVDIEGFQVHSTDGTLPIQTPTLRDLEQLFDTKLGEDALAGRKGGINAPTSADQDAYDQAGTPTEYKPGQKLFGKSG